jgi:hypothetical protein
LEEGKTIPADLGMTYFTDGSAGTSPASTAASGWVYATFFNKSDVDISFYWIPFSPNDTTKMLWKTLKPGKQFMQRTMKTMVWETKYVNTDGGDVWLQRWLPGAANWKSDAKVMFCSGRGDQEAALKFYICQPRAAAQSNSDKKVELNQNIKPGETYEQKKSCAAACKFATDATTVDDATRVPSSKCPSADLDCSLFRAPPANLDSIPESCATFSPIRLPAVLPNQYQEVTMEEEPTAEDEQRFRLTSDLPADCRNSLSERVLAYSYGDSSNSMYLSVYKGTSATLPGVTFTINTYETDAEKGSGTGSDSGLKAWHIVLIILGCLIVVGTIGFLVYWHFCMLADQSKKNGAMEVVQSPGLLKSSVSNSGRPEAQLVANNQIVPVNHEGLKLPKGESQAKDSVLTAKDGLAVRSKFLTGHG